MKIPAKLQRVALACMVILLIVIFRSAWANPLPPDSDNDGMLDVWEIQYFGNLSQGPNTDFDGDGVSNLIEFRQGRNPKVGGTVADTNGLTGLNVYTPLIFQ
jgi:hypothetical protein